MEAYIRKINIWKKPLRSEDDSAATVEDINRVINDMNDNVTESITDEDANEDQDGHDLISMTASDTDDVECR